MVNNDAVVRTSYYKYFHPKVVVAVLVMMMVALVVLVIQPACFGAGCYIEMATSYH